MRDYYIAGRDYGEGLGAYHCDDGIALFLWRTDSAKRVLRLKWSTRIKLAWHTLKTGWPQIEEHIVVQKSDLEELALWARNTKSKVA